MVVDFLDHELLYYVFDNLSIPSIYSEVLALALHTGKSLSEALIFASINPQYHENYKRRTWAFHGNSMKNLLSYCGLIDAKISASEKDLPVL